MKEKERFIKALGGLFFEWGGDTPQEVYWGANDLLNWYEVEYGIELNISFESPCKENGYKLNYDEVIEAIRNS